MYHLSKLVKGITLHCFYHKFVFVSVFLYLTIYSEPSKDSSQLLLPIMVPRTPTLYTQIKVPTSNLPSRFNILSLSYIETSNIQPHISNVSPSFLQFFLVFWFYLVHLFKSKHVFFVDMCPHQVCN